MEESAANNTQPDFPKVVGDPIAASQDARAEIASVFENAPPEQSTVKPMETVAEALSVQPAAAQQDVLAPAEAVPTQAIPQENVIASGSVVTPEPTQAAPGAVEAQQPQPSEVVAQAEALAPEPATQPTPPAQTAATDSIVSDAKPMETNQVGTQSRSTKLADIGKKHHDQHNWIAILISIIVVTGLVAIGYLAYTGDNDNDVDTSTTTETTQQDTDDQMDAVQSTLEPITEEEIDSQTEAIDELVDEIDSIGDFDDEDISDESLGL